MNNMRDDGGKQQRNKLLWNVILVCLILGIHHVGAFVVIDSSNRHFPFQTISKQHKSLMKMRMTTTNLKTDGAKTNNNNNDDDDNDNAAVDNSRMGEHMSTSTSSSSSSGLGLSVRRASEIVSVTGQAAWPLLLSLFTSKEEVWTEEKCRNVVTALEQLGPTFVKFGQALSSRPDILPPTLTQALSSLCDDMTPCFDTITAKSIIQTELLLSSSSSPSSSSSNKNQTTTITIDSSNKEDALALLESLSEEPVAAASVGQVYRAKLANGKDVAVKIQRPNIRTMIDGDTQLLQLLAQVVDSSNLVRTNLTGAVQEFMSRIWEELDYINEANNARIFANLYSHINGTMIHRLQLPQDKNSKNKNKKPAGVIVPEIYMHLCTPNVLVMEWIDGTKLTSTATTTTHSNGSSKEEQERLIREENLELIQQALYVTLCQLLDTGVMHADPHGGNLLKTKDTKQLAYLDFGLLATIPETVRDALVCAVVQMVFKKDVEAVASLFAELDLIPPHVMSDPNERLALTEALQDILDNVLDYDYNDDKDDNKSQEEETTTTDHKNNNNNNINNNNIRKTVIPKLKFDKLLDGLTKLIPRFQFQLPPYFVNNARALGTLEGIAKSLDPQFNALQLMYPYSLQRLLTNPSQSPIIDQTLRSLFYDDQNILRVEKIQTIMDDSALLTGYTKRQIFYDIYQTKGGKQLIYQMAKDSLRQVLFHPQRQKKRQQRRNRYDYFKL